MATDEQILETLRTAMLRVIRVDRDAILLDAHLIDDLEVDSLGMVELLMEIETDFDVVIPETELQHLEHVKDVVAFIKANS